MSVLAELLGESPGVVALREKIRQLLSHVHRSGRLPPILLQGETGTGKGLLARLIHRESPRRDGPFLDVNCAAIPDTLLEAELFGFERGAFTDARQAKAGLLQAAHRGTIFLDEVGLLPEALQAKLLKVIEERAVRRLGSIRTEPVDVWILSATNEDLAAAVRRRRFREDLYHRLAVVTLTLPPLRDRGDDVLSLAEHFLSRACTDYDLPSKMLSADARSALLAYRWPGNIRELGNIIERVALLADGPMVTAATFGLPEASGSFVESIVPEGRVPSHERVPSAEREELSKALWETNWNLSRAAERLGIPRNTLRYRMEKHGLRSRGSGPRRQHGRGVRGPAPAPAIGDVRSVARPSAVRWELRYIALLRVDLLTSPTAGPIAHLGRALTVLVDKIRSFGGFVQDLNPTGIVAAFGLEPVEDAPNRAALAAMTIRKAGDRVGALEPDVSGVKAAVHVAQVTVGRFGGTLQIDSDGKRAAAIALEALARLGDAGSIVVSERAAPFLERRFELVDPRRLPGEAGHCYRLVRREATGFGLGGRPLTRFIGRDPELEILRERLEQTSRGRGQVVGVVGDPGVGKSRFVHEFIRFDRLKGWSVLSGACASYAVATPYLPITDLLKRYFQIDEAETLLRAREKVTEKILMRHTALAPHLPPLLALLDLPVDDVHWRSLEPHQRRQRTLDALKHFLLKESQSQVLVLVLEDLHWIDSETQALLDSLVDTLAAARILLLVTYRPEYRHGWGSKTYYTQLRIDPLPPERAAEFPRSLLGDDASVQPLASVLIERTEGNPFFLEESVRTLVETQVLVGARGAYRLVKALERIRVPATVQAVLAARIDRLPPEEKRLLEFAAVIGKDVPFSLLRAIAEVSDEDIRRSLTGLQAAEFIYETRLVSDVGYAFKHTLTHEVAYGSLLQEQRRHLHARIGEAIEALCADRLDEQAPILAYHYTEAGLKQQAVRYWERAGQRAILRSANIEATAYLIKGLDVLMSLPETAERTQRELTLQMGLATSLVATKGLSAPEPEKVLPDSEKCGILNR